MYPLFFVCIQIKEEPDDHMNAWTKEEELQAIDIDIKAETVLHDFELKLTKYVLQITIWK